jgi:putative transposase
MSPIKSTKPAVYDRKYPFVWAPKYRKKLLTGDIVAFVQQILSRIATDPGWEIEEMALQPDHVHMLMHAPPKYAPAKIAQVRKRISAREIFRHFPQLRRQLWAGEFWNDGDFVRSVGDQVTADLIKKYISYQADTDEPKQLGLWD